VKHISHLLHNLQLPSGVFRILERGKGLSAKGADGEGCTGGRLSSPPTEGGHEKCDRTEKYESNYLLVSPTVPTPQKFFQFSESKWRVLVHSGTLL